MTARINRASWVMALLILLAPLPFLSEHDNPNMFTRMMLAIAIVEDGTVQIDPYAERTIDKAFYEGHYYSDKAPGIAFMSIPPYWIARAVSSAMGHELEFFPDLDVPESPQNEIARTLTLRFVILMTSGAIAAFAGALFFRFAADVSGSLRTAALATASIFLGSTFLGWSTQLFGHAAAGAALFVAFYHCFYLNPNSNGATWRAITAGAFLGLSILIEYVSAPAVALIAVYAITRLTAFPRRQAFMLLALALIACAIFIAPILVYHKVSFGGMFNTGYSNVVGFEGMEAGFMGLTYPKRYVLLRITFGFTRGIIWLVPILIVAPYGAWRSVQDNFLRSAVILSVLIVAYYLLLNSSYFYWRGGGSTGPRHIVPSLPFMGICMIWLWVHAKGPLRWFMYVALALGIVLSLACTSVSMTIWPSHWLPLKDPIFDAIFLGTSPDERYRLSLEWYEILGWPTWGVAAVWAAVLAGTSLLFIRMLGRD